ncbi:hypothetical protein [Ignatzschineria sp. LJL83]
MKIMSKYVFVAILSLVSISLTVAKGEIYEGGNINYIADFRYQNMYCNFYINKIPIHTSSDRDLNQQWSFVDRVGMMLKEGRNSFEIEGIDIPVDHTDAFCEVTITAFMSNPDTKSTESKEVSSLRLTYDDNNIFTAIESKEYSESTVTDNPILETLGFKTYYDEREIQDNIMVSRSLVVNHAFNTHSWKYLSTPFEDTPRNREKLWQKYEEIRQIMNEKNYKKYVNSRQPGLSETERYQGNPDTNSWEDSVLNGFKQYSAIPNLYMEPIERDEYILMISNDGLLFRFGGSGKGNPERLLSPLHFENGKDEYWDTNITFTLIDGEIVPAF